MNTLNNHGIYSIKAIRNGWVVRTDEDEVCETFFDTKMDALEALAIHIGHRIDEEKELLEVENESQPAQEA